MNAMLSHFAEYFGDVIFQLDLEGRIDCVSESVSNSLKRAPADLTGRWFKDLGESSGLAELLDDVAAAAADGSIRHARRRLIDGAGVWVEFDLAVRPIGDMDNTLSKILVLARRVDDDIGGMSSSADFGRVKAELFTKVGEQLRTPLTSIIGFADLVRLTKPQGPEVSRYLSCIQKSAWRLNSMVDDLLTSQDPTEFDFEGTEIDLCSFMGTVLDEFSAPLKHKGLRVGLVARSALPDHIQISKAGLQGVVSRLVDNAIKFSSSGSIEVALDVKPGEPSWLTVSVIDHGVGVSENFRTRLFELFDQARDPPVNPQGLGLAACQRLVSKMAGWLDYEATPAGGATFSVTLPFWEPRGGEDAGPGLYLAYH